MFAAARLAFFELSSVDDMTLSAERLSTFWRQTCKDFIGEFRNLIQPKGKARFECSWLPIVSWSARWTPAQEGTTTSVWWYSCCRTTQISHLQRRTPRFLLILGRSRGVRWRANEKEMLKGNIRSIFFVIKKDTKKVNSVLGIWGYQAAWCLPPFSSTSLIGWHDRGALGSQTWKLWGPRRWSFPNPPFGQICWFLKNWKSI